VAVAQHAVFDVPAHGAREHDTFDVTPDRGEALGRQRVVDALDALLDDQVFTSRIIGAWSCVVDDTKSRLAAGVDRPHRGHRLRKS
jgi:hypothetical protein